MKTLALKTNVTNFKAFKFEAAELIRLISLSNTAPRVKKLNYSDDDIVSYSSFEVAKENVAFVKSLIKKYSVKF